VLVEGGDSSGEELVLVLITRLRKRLTKKRRPGSPTRMSTSRVGIRLKLEFAVHDIP
jgi:hypothetical protein